jgi:hypothetical protein
VEENDRSIGWSIERMNSLATTGSSSGAGASGSRSFGSGDMKVADGEGYVRADTLDLTKLDEQLEKSRSRVWLDHQRSASPRELLEWEIDLGKLDIDKQVASGTFGVVYRGTYDGDDVAGTYPRLASHLSTCNSVSVRDKLICLASAP